MHTPSILLLAGETSGDYHAAAMVRDLKRVRPDIRITGIGGDALAGAGMELLFHCRDMHTIALTEGLDRVRQIAAAYGVMKRELRRGGHDLFVPVDYPDVNLRLCRVARAAGVPVCWYIGPQVWAWRRWRLRTIARNVDRVMNILPFEEKIYRDAGVDARFVGNTLARDIRPAPDRKALRREMGIDPATHAVALVPGSRPAEVRRLLPLMCEAARIYGRRFPGAVFLLPLAGSHLAALVREIVSPFRLPLTVHEGAAERVMAACDSGLVKSGTATLQAALAEMPHAVVYRLDRPSWILAYHILRPLVMAADLHVALPNVLAIYGEGSGEDPIRGMIDAGCDVRCLRCGRPLFVPELLQDDAAPEAMAGWLIRFQSDMTLREATRRGFRAIRRMLEPAGESRTAASVVLDLLAAGGRKTSRR